MITTPPATGSVTLAEALARFAGWQVYPPRPNDPDIPPGVQVMFMHKPCGAIGSESHLLLLGRPGPPGSGTAIRDLNITQSGVTLDEFVTSILNHEHEDHDGPPAPEVDLGWRCPDCRRIEPGRFADDPAVTCRNGHDPAVMEPVTFSVVADTPR